MIGGDFTNTWLRRVGADDVPAADAGAKPVSAARALAVGSRDGWDPWEVWLRHIDQPRRRNAGRLRIPD